MQIRKRTRPHVLETDEGWVLIADRSAPDAPLQFPPVEFVQGDRASAEVTLGPIGTLHSWTVVHAGRGPAYGLAMVDFAPGVRVFGRLLPGAGRPTMDGDVRVVPFDLPDGTPDYAFAPIESAR